MQLVASFHGTLVLTGRAVVSNRADRGATADNGAGAASHAEPDHAGELVADVVDDAGGDAARLLH